MNNGTKRSIASVINVLANLSPWFIWVGIWHFEKDRIERLEILVILLAVYAFQTHRCER